MRRIIAISGKQRSGKDTLARMVKQCAPCQAFKIKSFATPIKQYYAEKHRISPDDVEVIKTDPEVRAELIKIGADGRAITPLYWVRRALIGFAPLIIPDLRFRNERDHLEGLQGAQVKTVRLDVDREIRLGRGVLSNEDDLSECDLDDVQDWDFQIKNPSLDELQSLAEMIAEVIAEELMVETQKTPHLKR
jgi:phosphomevalonate kinase